MSLPPPPPPPPHWSSGQPEPPGPSAYPYRPSADHPNATTILVLGILSIVVCGVLGPIAWVMGNNAMREMNANPGVEYRNRGNVSAGRVCGIIGTVMLALSVLAFLFMFIVFAGTSSQ